VQSKEYVRDIYHVNTLEGHWWSLVALQRAIKGTHCTSAQSARKYVAEFSFRRNMRYTHSCMFNLLTAAISQLRL